MPPENEFTTSIELNPHFVITSVRAVDIHFSYNQNLNIEEVEALKNTKNSEITYSEFNIGTNYGYENGNLQVNVGINVNVLVNNILLATLKVQYIGDFICTNVEKADLSLIDFATQNAPAIVYPYVRQAVNFLTSQAGFPPLVLPVLMMKKQKS